MAEPPSAPAPAARARVERAVAFLAAGGVLLLYALDGGAYDTVVLGQLGIAAWWVLTLGVVIGLLPRTRPTAGLLVVVLSVLGLTVWTALSLGWTDSQERTTIEIARLVHHLGILVLAWAAFDRRTWTTAAGGLTAAAVIVCALAFVSRLAPDVLVANVYGPEGGRRLSYPLNYWNANAAWGAMTMAMLLGWSVHPRLAVRVPALAVVPLVAVVTYLTYSRAGAIGTAAGAILVVAIAYRRWQTFAHVLLAALATAPVILAVRGRPEIVEGTGDAGAGGLIAILVACCAACALVPFVTAVAGLDRARMGRTPARTAFAAGALALAIAGAVAGPRLADRAWDSFSARNAAAVPDDPAQRLNLSGNRYNIFASAIDAAEEHPLKGVGAGTFEFWWNVDARDPEFIRDGHSLYLETAAELGVPGLLLLLGLIGGGALIAVAARRGSRTPEETTAAAALAGGAAVFLVHAGVDWVWESTAVAVLALASVGVLAAGVGPERVPSRRARRLLIGGAVVVGVIAFVVQLPPVVSTSKVRDSQTAAQRGDMVTALADARAAAEALPWAASPYLQRALVLEAQGRLDAALVDARRAEEREPTNWRHPLVRARLEAAAGDVDAALRAYRRARSLRPLAKIFEPKPRSGDGSR